MGITIHFEGRLRDEHAFKQLITTAKSFAQEKGWAVTGIGEPDIKPNQFRQGGALTDETLTKGVLLEPHPQSEPIRLEFDRNLELQASTKTQFAPPEIHREIVTLLDHIAPYFATFSVIDEAEYYDLRSEEVLLRHRNHCTEMLEEHLANDKTLRGPVRLPSGRILDLIRDVSS